MLNMLKCHWNTEKNQWLKANRQIDFEELVKNGQLLNIRLNTSVNHPGQYKMAIKMNNKMYAVPFVFEKDGSVFFKTAFRDRKLDREFLGNKV